ncbi:hypothetical protein PVK06_037562 [Gossypium arboreum]|uniref:RNase H type-1 domain-containing protein n=1 Tax=Gossypium arboreum TaxID=29729 RepID=A0ABR0MXP3_GOSAR|nr:hypothetical protein PVK06_037562 [Gossypium arboreum]
MILPRNILTSIKAGNGRIAWTWTSKGCYLLGTLKRLLRVLNAVFGVSVELSGTPKSQAMPSAFAQRSITDSGLETQLSKGLLRDTNGLGFTTVFQAEASALLEGLRLALAWDKGYGKMEVERDNASLIQFICSGYASRNRLSELRQIQVMHSRN